MDPHPQLRLVCHPPSRPAHTPLFADADRAQLWKLVRDRTSHLLVRAPRLLELARRRDPDLISFCEGLLTSKEKEDWFLALKAIAALDTPEATEKLVMIFAGTLSNDDRLYIINIVARCLTADFVHPFSIMVRDLARPGEIDVSDWTKTAVSTLQDVCKRYGILTVAAPPYEEHCTEQEVIEEDILKA